MLCSARSYEADIQLSLKQIEHDPEKQKLTFSSDTEPVERILGNFGLSISFTRPSSIHETNLRCAMFREYVLRLRYLSG